MLVALLAAPAGAESWRMDAYNDLMSPYCPGRTLADCPSGDAAELRAWIGAQEEAGRSREDVEAQLYRMYGDVLRSAPRAQGWGLLAYATPALALAAGGALLFFFLRRQGRGSVEPPAPVPVAHGDRELERQVEEELRSGAR